MWGFYRRITHPPNMNSQPTNVKWRSQIATLQVAISSWDRQVCKQQDIIRSPPNINASVLRAITADLWSESATNIPPSEQDTDGCYSWDYRMELDRSLRIGLHCAPCSSANS